MQPDRIKYEQWLALDKSYIDDCDCILRIPGDSTGADQECAYAASHYKPIFLGLPDLINNTHPEASDPDRIVLSTSMESLE
jgi:hypothetical protein